jgi:hypothetical protein
MNCSTRSRAINVLLIEDNPGDVDLAKAALRNCKTANQITVACDGEEAMMLLRQAGDPPRKPLPDLVLLDLNMSRKSGIEVLAEIKQDPALRRIPWSSSPPPKRNRTSSSLMNCTPTVTSTNRSGWRTFVESSKRSTTFGFPSSSCRRLSAARRHRCDNANRGFSCPIKYEH